MIYKSSVRLPSLHPSPEGTNIMNLVWLSPLNTCSVRHPNHSKQLNLKTCEWGKRQMQINNMQFIQYPIKNHNGKEF